VLKRNSKAEKAIFISLLVTVVLAISFLFAGHIYANNVFASLSSARYTASLFEQTSFIYGEDGSVVKEVHGEINRVPVPLEQIPQHVQQAFIAIEDERFYNHRGVDLKAILRAGFNYYKAGRVTEGGSTITQQTMKMYFLSPEQSLWRKIKEAILAVEFERRYSKDTVLELYLNRAYFGEGAYGIQAAAKTYFNKDSSQLSVAEGALLAALVQAPSNYDPYVNPDYAKERRNIVIEKMYEQGYLLRNQADEAIQSPIVLTNHREHDSNDSYLTDYIISEAIAAVGEDKLLKGGLKIYSTMEPELQSYVEKVLANSSLFPSGKVQAAVALVENDTGAIKALVGGREYVTRYGFNRATQLLRQPGSTFKPIAVYAPAFEAGYRPSSLVSDSPFKVGDYEPKNSDGSFYGTISIKTAVQWSRNVAAVRLLQQIGVDKGFEMAQRLGFELTEEDKCLPLALGGVTKGVSPLQMAAAYAAFANKGIYIKPYAVKYIEDAEGNVIYSNRPLRTAAMKESTANAVVEVLRAVVTSGTGTRANIRGTMVAGKTGTTELPDTPEFKGLKGNKDAWFVGFTPKYTAAVWMGYDEKDMDRNHYLTSYGGNQPAEIFRLIMSGVMGLSGEATSQGEKYYTVEGDLNKEEASEDERDKRDGSDDERDKSDKSDKSNKNNEGNGSEEDPDKWLNMRKTDERDNDGRVNNTKTPAGAGGPKEVNAQAGGHAAKE